ncbi:hypothetical protein M899_1453 [Bacteriovorax sp. BSW11_IV]|uniref:hypothetical protein n=1 Tax=Bacteriovorax sp. BSW11_IV TaxID=1353529 RepID=UPI00038A2998|nr:hypothetical protein [Bacteriovorax sp. BSW11_IV]EQC48377.1 hypothetical protein M899_1453 [Bacteriovorax sp. BSW11_IV]
MNPTFKAALFATIILSSPTHAFVDNLNIQPEYKNLLRGILSADYSSRRSSYVDEEREKIYAMDCNELESEKQRRHDKQSEYQKELDDVTSQIGEERKKIDKIHDIIETVLSKGKLSQFVIDQIDLEVDRSLVFEGWAIKDWIKRNDSYLYTVDQLLKAKCQ